MKNLKGFTLIEMSVVMLLIMMAASLSMSLFTGIAQNTRYQITEARVAQIKQAIINVQTVNGTPTVSGFVADVGRLPYCIRELIDDYCDAVPPYASPCIPGTSGSTACASTQSPTSWKGPYLQTSDGTFYDGWGNTDTTYSADNFGWYFYLTTSLYKAALTVSQCSTSIAGTPTPTLCDTLTLQSYGADGIPDATGVTPTGYDADYPALANSVLIQPSDWTIDLSTTGLNVQFIHLPAVISPIVTTTCAPAAALTTNLTGTTVTSTCPIGTTSVTSTIDCPTGYNAFGAPAPTVVGQNATIFCQSATTSNIYASNITCSSNSTPPTVLTLTAALPSSALPTAQTVAVTCTSNPSPSTATVSVMTPLSQACATGVPVTLLILANDLYGNSIIPTPITGGVAPWSLPSTCNQFYTVNYTDFVSATLPLPSPLPSAPMSIGNWNICAFQSSTILPTFTSPISYTTCLSAVGHLSLSDALYSATITVLPHTTPSIAW